MARTFTITCAAGTIRLAGQVRGECSFTVTNTSAAVMRAHPTVIALDARAQKWFGVVGEPVRELAPGQTVQITVAILPAGAPPGRYPFRLDVLPAEGGERSAGPEACVELTSEAAPLPVGSKPFPWWWLVIAAAVLVIIAVVLWLVLRDSQPATTAASVGKDPTSAETAKPTDDGKPPMSAQPTTKDGEVQDVVEQWLVAFRRKNAKALTTLTTAPAVIDGQRANDANAILKLYSILLEQGRAPTRGLTTTKQAQPVMARVKDLRTKMPREVKDIGLADDDHAVGVTVPDSDLTFVLLIRQESPPRISGVAR